MLTWEELGARALARQFPAAELPVPDLVAATGPIQAQTARSPFIGLAARSPLATYDALSDAYRNTELVRGSNIRGTVHTSTPAQQRALDAVTRVGMRRNCERSFGLAAGQIEEFWSSLEDFASEAWRTPDQLVAHAHSWLTTRDLTTGVTFLDHGMGRYFTFAVGMVRRPVKGEWSGQGAPEYRSARAVTGLPLPTASEGIDAALSGHLRCHGPASRQDLAWWSGLPLTHVQAATERLADVLSSEPGPLDRDYFDVPGAPDPGVPPGVRLLPEFDALLCGYDSKSRDRFVTRPHHDRLWSPANGLLLPPLLVDGRITGFWRSMGTAKRRPLEISYFSRTRRPRKGEVAEAVARLEAGLGITITQVTLTRD